MLYRSTQRLRRAGASMKNLAHVPSLSMATDSVPSYIGTEHLGLLFIVPEKVRESHLSKVGVNGPTLDAKFMTRLSKLPKRIERLFEENSTALNSVRSRVRLASVSWTWLRDQLEHIEGDLDSHSRGEQTLLRLLAGLRAQIEDHKDTGIP